MHYGYSEVFFVFVFLSESYSQYTKTETPVPEIDVIQYDFKRYLKFNIIQIT